ncbi:MAG TPA: NADH-quinone oxidoreductase subunit C [Vicinamibacterales bacterium]|nr:NADH-quinone oxidoreductase subunit C [Vicinamibacterales bacterium]
MTAADLIAAIAPAVPGATYEALASADVAVTPTILVPREQLVATCRALQGPGLEFVAFSDVTAADYHPTRSPRFDLVYHLVSPHRRARVRLKVRLDAAESIESLTSLFPGAGWPEREVYDLFGIVFDGHADLRRLMMPDDWEGYPLRKDYPVQLRKDAQTYMPLQITEEEFKANMERDRYQRGAQKS